MIPRIAAIALLASRAAVRSRVVLVLAALLLLALTGLPGWLRGDGTPHGMFTLLVGHTLGVCFFLLAATSLWAGCAAIAVERGAGIAALTTVKPVRPVELWVGKWLGIVALDALLLCAVGAGLWLQLILREQSLPADWRRCERVIPCLLPDPADEAGRILHTLRQEGRMPTDLSEGELRAALIRQVRNRYTLINPGESHAWRFRLPDRKAVAAPPLLRAVFETQYGLREEAMVSVGARSLPATSAPFETETPLMAGEPLMTALPPLFAEPGTTAEITFRLAPDAQSPLLLHPGRNLALLLPGGLFERNLALASLLLLAVLAALAACGLALGSCFSFPVASFAAAALVILALLGSGAADGPVQAEESATFMERAGHRIIRGTSAATRPLLTAAPISRLTRREEIPVRSLVIPLCIGFVAWPALLALLSAVSLTRRENGT